MYKRIGKLISVILVCILVFNIVGPILNIRGNGSEVFAAEGTLNTPIIADRALIRNSDAFDNIQIYSTSAAVKGQKIYANQKTNDYAVYIYSGVSMKIDVDKGIFNKYNGIQYELWLRRANQDVLCIDNCLYEDHVFSFDYDQIQSYKQMFGSDVNYAIKVYINKSSGRKLFNDEPIKVIVRETEHIIFSNKNANTSPDRKACALGFIVGSTLYMQPGATVYLTTDGDNSGRFSVNGTGLQGGGGAVTCDRDVPTGTTGKVVYNDSGVTTQLDIVISNLGTKNYSLNRDSVKKTEKMMFGNTSYTTTREIGLKYNQGQSIRLKQKKFANESDFKACKLEVKDLTGVSSTTPAVHTYADGYEISLRPIKDGVLKVVLYDYKNQPTTEYWHIVNSESAIVKIELPNEVDQEININNTPSDNTGDAQGGGTGSSSSSGSSTPSTPTYSTGGSSGSINLPSPEITFSNVKRSGNVFTFDVNATNATSSLYAVVKRTNPNQCTIPTDNYNVLRNYNAVGPANPSSFRIEFDMSQLAQGSYDVAVFSNNGSDENFASNIIGPYVVDNSTVLQKPNILPQGCTWESNNSIAKCKYNVTNCTELKWAIVKRDIDANGKPGNSKPLPSSYDSFNGTVVKNPASFTATINANTIGTGYYDIAIWAINSDKTIDATYIGGPMFAYVSPTIDITTKENTATSKKYAVTAKTVANTVETRYVIEKRKDGVKSYTQPSIDTLKKGTLLQNNSGTIEISVAKYGVGIYDLTIYSVDKYGRYRIETRKDLVLSNAPEVELQIEGATEGETSSFTPQESKDVNIIVKDKDSGDKLTVKYFISNDANIELTEASFKDAKTLMDKVSSGEKGLVKVEAEADKKTAYNRYVYFMITDLAGLKTIGRTGNVRVDGSPLSLEMVFADKDTDDVGYKLGDDLQVTFYFNHIMQEKYPDLKLFIGDKNTSIKQNSITTNENFITYHFNITKDTPNGKIVGLALDGSNKFTDVFKAQNVFDGKIDPNIDLVSNQFIIDTVAPKAKSVYICYTTDDSVSKLKEDSENIYIKNIKKITTEVEYNEEIVGQSPIAYYYKGNNASISAESTSPDDKVRTKDVYDLDEALATLKGKKCDGPITITMFYLGDASDLVGNDVDLKEYMYNQNVKYKLNGKEVSKNIVLDDNVYDVSGTVGNYTLSKNGEYCVPIGSTVTLFDEYAREEDCYDYSGIQKNSFAINYCGDDFEVLDKNGNAIDLGETVPSTYSGYDYMSRLDLTKEQLPISFKLNNKGKYKFDAVKQDMMGNLTSLTSIITTDNSVSLYNETSGFIQLDADTWYNGKTLEDKKKCFTVTLKLENGLTKDDIYVVAKNRKTYDAEYFDNISLFGENYEQFIFTPDRGGKYDILVYNKDGQVLLTDTVEAYNVFIPGDTNYDGLINGLDAVNILRYIAKFDDVYGVERFKRTCDVSGDGEIDIDDQILISRFIAENAYINSEGYLYINK